MIYEWRIYEVMPKKMKNLNERFINVTLRLFEKHGMRVIGFWQKISGERNTLYYMLAFDSVTHRDKAWKNFSEDTEWINARKKSHEQGQIVAKVTKYLLEPTSYSPLQ